MKNFDGLREHFTEVLDNLVENYDFGVFLRTRDHGDFNCWRDSCCDFDNYIDGMWFLAGASKAVIKFEEEDYVIKIPFYNTKGLDYCRVEYRNYLQAKKEGIEKMFAECYKLMDYGDCPIYIMELCDCGEETTTEVIASVLSPIREMNYDLNDEDEWADFHEEVYDDEDSVNQYLGEVLDQSDYEALTEFCFENEINDLHAGNIGFIGSRVVLIDYSGYGCLYGPSYEPTYWDCVDEFEREAFHEA